MEFYFFPASGPCRSVQLTAKALGLELNKKELNLMEGEHMGEEFLAINPQHCVPTLVDEDLTIWERYLVIREHLHCLVNQMQFRKQN